MSEQWDKMRQATTAKVCLDLAKSARFIVSVLSTASFNRPLLALSTICRCPSRSKERSWPRNRGHLANVHFYVRRATCCQPHVKGVTIMVNSLFNGWRMEDVWLDK
jgi:hypothetical protein